MTRYLPLQNSLLPIIVLALCLCFTGPVKAQQSNWQTSDNIQTRLISGVTAHNGEAFAAGLEIKLAPGWYTYWRMPGEGGLPPIFEWSTSLNMEKTIVHWPVPEPISTYGLMSFGYKDSVIFPLNVTPQDGDEAVTLAIDAEIMICNEICIPETFSLSMTIPAGNESIASPYSAILTRALTTVPQKGPTPAQSVSSVIVGPDALVLQLNSRNGFDDMKVLIENQSNLPLYAELTPDIITLDTEDARRATVRLPKPAFTDSLATALMNSPVTVFLITDDGTTKQDFEL